MGKYGFDDYVKSRFYYDDEDLGDTESDFDDSADFNEEAESEELEPEMEFYVCEDCNHSWQVEVSDSMDLYDYYNGDRLGMVCPMCGSFSIYMNE